jgi:cobalt-zinc-cadmium efflux system outer membrane protein
LISAVAVHGYVVGVAFGIEPVPPTGNRAGGAELRIIDLEPRRSTAHAQIPERLPDPARTAIFTNNFAEQPDAAMRLAQPPIEEIAAPKGLTVNELVEIALANNPTLVQAVADVEAARGKWLQVGLYPNPSIAYLGNQIGDQGTAGQQGAYVEQEFVRGRKLPLNRAVADREISIAQRQLDAQRMRVVNDVRIQFYNTLVAQRALEVSQELLSIGEKAYSAAKDMLEAQQVSRVDVLQAHIEVNSARIGLTNAQNRHQASWRTLASVIGVPGMNPAQMQGDLLADAPQFEWESSLGRLLAESPELVSTRIGVDRAVWALRRARAEPIPNVTVQAGPQYDLGNNQTITNVNVALPIPLFNYNQGNIRKAEAEIRSARAEVARTELQLTARLAAEFESYANAHNQVVQYREQILPSAREALELVTNGYRQGEIGYLLLLTTQRTYFANSLASLEAQRELWESAVAIDGLLLTDSLNVNTTISVPLGGAGQMAVPNGAFLGK